MADNPILQWSDVVAYDRQRLPATTDARDIEGAGHAVADLIKGVEVQNFNKDLAAADQATLDDVRSQISKIDDVVGKATTDLPPGFQEAVRQIAKGELMKQQGVGDATAIAIHRETVLRSWTARHPEWAGDLLRAANAVSGGSTIGEAIQRATGPKATIDDVETHARQLGSVDMSLMLSNPVEFGVQYVKATKEASKLQSDLRTLQMLQAKKMLDVENGTTTALFNSAIAGPANKAVDDFTSVVIKALGDPTSPAAPQALAQAQAGARLELATGVRFMIEASGGAIKNEEEAITRAPVLGHLKAIAQAADPQEALAIATGSRAAITAEKEGWWANTDPEARDVINRLKTIAIIDPSGQTTNQQVINERARLWGAWAAVQKNHDTNSVTGVQIPRKDSVGVVQTPAQAARSTYDLTRAAAQGIFGQEFSDRHMLNLADEWKTGTRPSDRAVQLATDYMADTSYRDTVAKSNLPQDLRQERAGKITTMLVESFAKSEGLTPANGGPPLQWTKAFSGLKWTGDHAELTSDKVDPTKANAQASQKLTQMVRATAHASGISYELAAQALWAIMQSEM